MPAEGHAGSADQATALEELERFEEADAAWNRLVLAAPRFPMHHDRALLGRARCLRHMGRFDAAADILTLQCAVTLSPALLAEIESELGRIGHARSPR